MVRREGGKLFSKVLCLFVLFFSTPLSSMLYKWGGREARTRGKEEAGGERRERESVGCIYIKPFSLVR